MNEASLATAGDWLATHGVRIALIIVGAWVLLRLIDGAVTRSSRTFAGRAARLDREQRERIVTMTGVLHSLSAVRSAYWPSKSSAREDQTVDGRWGIGSCG